MGLKTVRLVLMILGFGLTVITALAQDDVVEVGPTPVDCGSIIESSFSNNFEAQSFSLRLKAGDQFTASVTPRGGGLESGIAVLGPTNIGLLVSNGDANSRYIRVFPETQPRLTTGTLSADGTYTAIIYNFRLWSYYFLDDWYQSYDSPKGVGNYTLSISCVLNDGTIINAGDPIVDPTQDIIITPIPPASPSPVFPDFLTAQISPLTPGTPVFGAVSPGGSEVFAYTLDAEGGSLLDLTFSKAGNLNLSFVVLSSDGQVLFQTNLVNLTEIKTSLTIPDAGTYTIGVYRIDLLPPAAPEATAFQVQGTLNP